MSSQKVVIIGGGYAGLATAALLAKRGNEVTLLEKNADLGGRGRVWKQDAYTFDLGPSWYMMPEVFERYFGLFGKQVSDFYELVQLDPAYRLYSSHTAEAVDVHSSREALIQLIESRLPGSRPKVERFLADAERKYRVATERFTYRPYDRFTDLLDWSLIKIAPQMGMIESVGAYVRRLFPDPFVQELLTFHTVFLGGSPDAVPSLFTMMNYADVGKGIWYPQGGFGKLTTALQSLASQHGVTIRTKAPVEKIIVQNGKVAGVMVQGEKLEADLVIGAADYAHIQRSMLAAGERSYSERYWRSRQVAPSCLLVYLGLDTQLETLPHHTFSFGPSTEGHPGRLFDQKYWPTAPSFYVSRPSYTDPTLAPAGHDALMLLVPIPARDDETDAMRESLAEHVVARLSAHTGVDINAHTVVRRLYSGRDFTEDYNALRGTAFGLAHTLWQTAVFRPRIQDKKVAGLYYAGQYTHPGIGVPITLISAEIVSDLIGRQQR